MSILTSLFNSAKINNENSKKASFPWESISDVNQIEELIVASKNNTVVIFKHSIRCGISRSILKAFEKQTEPLDGTKFYFLDLINHRDVSNKLASEFNIVHQSPQLIVLKDGKVVTYNSHYDLLSIAI